jgi:cyclase
MIRVRLIARQDFKGLNLIKGIYLEGLRFIGYPREFARLYYKQGVDEIVYMDIVASPYGRNSLHDIVRNTAKDVFFPLTVGGAIALMRRYEGEYLALYEKEFLEYISMSREEFLVLCDRFRSPHLWQVKGGEWKLGYTPWGDEDMYA